MNQDFLCKLSPKHGSGKQRLVLGGLLLALAALSLIGQDIKASGSPSVRRVRALATATAINVNPGADGTLPGASGKAMAAEPAVGEQTFTAGSYIIPMDNVAQSTGMLRAYGLVYALLRNHVPVQWTINPAKSVNGDDFSISAGTLRNVRDGAAVPEPHTYGSGPFVIAAPDAAAARPIIQAWQAVAGDTTVVHQLTSGSFAATVARALVGAPRIGVLKDGNETIAFNNLNAAGIPDSLGNVWASASPDLLTEDDVAGPTTTDHGDGVLFHSGGLPRYGYLISEHYNTTSSTPEVVQEVRSWLDRSELTHAFMQCVSARVFENADGGLYLTNTGLDDDGAAPTTPINQVPAHPLTQMNGTFEVDSGAVDSMTSSSFRAGVTTLINENGATLTQRIVLLTGRLDGVSLNGRVTYLAGHDYALDLPVTSNPQTNGVRLFLNSLFASDCASEHLEDALTLTNSAPAFISTNQIPYTITYTNTGVQPAENLRLTDVLPPGTAYVAGSADPVPTSVTGGMLTWNLPPLAAGAAGSVTFQVHITGGAGSYTNTTKLDYALLTVGTISLAPVTTTTCPTINAVVGGGGTICPAGTVPVTVTITGGIAPYTVTLTNGGGTKTGASPLVFNVSPTMTTTYNVATAIDANGCTVMDTGNAMVTVNLAPNASAGNDQTLCQTIPGPTVVTLTGTVANATAQWSVVSHDDTITGVSFSNAALAAAAANLSGFGRVRLRLTATSDTTPACGLVTSEVLLTVNVTTAITTPPANQTVNAGQSANFSVVAAGVNLTYQWRKNGVPIDSATASTYSIAAARPGDAAQYDVVVTGACGVVISPPARLTVNCPTITVNPATLPPGQLTQPYGQTFTQAGGAGAITWNVSAGSLPANLTLNSSTGLLSGTPAVTGTFNFTIQATDASLCAASRAYTLVINGAAHPGLQFYPLAHPVRLLDTRPGFSGCYTPNAAILGGTSRTQPARGMCDGLNIPADAMAVTGNITTVQSGGGYLTLYPSDAVQPVVANSNYTPDEIINNVFTVGLSNADGAFKIFVTSTTNIVIDVSGYYAPPATGGLYFHPLPKPIRLLETRAGFTGCNAPGAPLPGGLDTLQLARLTCGGVTIPTTASAIVGNATTVNPQGPGFPYLTLFPADAARPLVASSNYLPGQVVNAPFTVGLSAAGEFKIYPTTQTDLVIDVLGYYSADSADMNGAGLLFNPLPHPMRLLETRLGFTGCYKTNAPLAGGSIQAQPARGVCDGVTIAAGALGIVGNATVVNSNGGYLTFWPSTAVQPLVATSNFAAGQVFNRHFTVGLGAGDGAFNIFTQFQTDLVVDVSGYFAP